MAGSYKNKRETENGNIVYEYSEEQIKKREKEKAKKVEELSQSIDDLRDQAHDDLGGGDLKKKMKALAVLIIDETYGRVGNENSASKGHYGVTVIKEKHVSFSNGKATLEYTGKSGVDQEKVIEDKKIVEALKEVVSDKDENERVFDYKDGDTEFKVRSRDVNRYLDDFNITAKDLRGFHANRLMKETLEEKRSDGKNLPDDKDEREKILKDEFKEALEEVADQIGHEPDTLKNSYLVPNLEDTFIGEGDVISKFDKNAKITSTIAHIVLQEKGLIMSNHQKIASTVAEVWLKKKARGYPSGVQKWETKKAESISKALRSVGIWKAYPWKPVFEKDRTGPVVKIGAYNKELNYEMYIKYQRSEDRYIGLFSDLEGSHSWRDRFRSAKDAAKRLSNSVSLIEQRKEEF